MTEEHKASRTIVKSPPELWAECSVAGSLSRHLGQFGEIRITRLEPEATVAWEVEYASGTVRLEPSGWGTQVTLTATPVVVAVPEPEVAAEPEVAGEGDAEPDEELGAEHLPRWQVFARLWGRLGRKMPVEHEDEVTDDAAPDDRPADAEVEAPDPVAEEPEPLKEGPLPVAPGLDHQALLVGALDSLGQAHHRPFSRA
jgi:hypothetical protein